MPDRLSRPFELAVTLNPAVEPAAVTAFATQDEANAAVEAEASGLWAVSGLVVAVCGTVALLLRRAGWI